jgi:hypothetical protein
LGGRPAKEYRWLIIMGFSMSYFLVQHSFGNSVLVAISCPAGEVVLEHILEVVAGKYTMVAVVYLAMAI